MKSKLVKFEPDLLKRIIKAAKAQHISAAQYIRNACREQLGYDESSWKDKRDKAAQE